MADIFRAPLIFKAATPRDIPYHRTPPSLLVTTLAAAVVALPAGVQNNAEAFPRFPQHPSHNLTINADTTQDVQKTLTADAKPPFANAPHFSGRRQWQQRFQPQPDTSRGIPKTLTADASVPIVNAPQFLAHRKHQWFQPADTSDPSPLTTFATPQPFPIGLNAPQFGPIDPWKRTFLPADTSSETPKTLTLDALTPFVNAPVFAPQRQWQVKFQPADTSDPSPLTTFPVAAALPVGLNTPHLVPLRFWWQPTIIDAQAVPDTIPPAVIVPPVVVTPETFSGGYPARVKRVRGLEYVEPPSAEEVQRERERLGILPKKARKAIEQVAKRELASVKADQESIEQAYTEFRSGALQERVANELRSELREQKQRYQAAFVPVLEAILAEGLRQQAQRHLEAQQRAYQIAQAAQQEEQDIQQILAIWLEM